MLFRYIDNLPAIPQNLLNELLPGITDQKLQFVNPDRQLSDGSKNILYQRWELTANLEKWIRENITANFDTAGIQILDFSARQSERLLPHTDSSPRRWVLNYSISAGGDNVITSFYQEKDHPIVRDPLCRPDSIENLELLESHKIQCFRWHLLKTCVIHEVVGVTSQRIAISLGIDSDDPERFVKLD